MRGGKRVGMSGISNCIVFHRRWNAMGNSNLAVVPTGLLLSNMPWNAHFYLAHIHP